MPSSAVWYTTPYYQPVNMNLHSYQTLPDEILCEIFLRSLSSSPFDDHESQEDGDIIMSYPSSRMTTPFTLSAVCPLWREIVRRDPRLWSSVYLVATPNKAEQQAHLLEYWLSLTGTSSLTIEIDCSHDENEHWNPDDPERVSPLLRAILEHSSRIVAFRTRLPPSCLHIPTNSPDPLFTNLNSLSVVPLDGGNEEDEGTNDIGLFQEAFKLRQVVVREIVFEQLTIPWENLTKVTTMSVYMEDCIKILRATSERVEDCSFEGILCSEHNIEPIPIILPRLNRLRLEFTEIDASLDLITQIITAPELKTLEYLTQDNDDFPVDDFVSCIQRSQCRLTTLAIIRPCMTVGELQICLGQVALSVEYLVLDLTSDVGDPFFTTDTTPQVLVPSFPRLGRFTFKGPTSIIHSFVELAYLS